MKRMALAAFVAVSIARVSVAENLPADYVEVEHDKERIKDVWEPVYREYREQRSDTGGERWVVNGEAIDHYEFFGTRHQRHRSYRLEIAPAAVEGKPKWFNLIDEKKRRTMLGIYELKGDELKVCFNHPGIPRPSSFETAPDSPRQFYLLKRSR